MTPIVKAPTATTTTAMATLSTLPIELLDAIVTVICRERTNYDGNVTIPRCVHACCSLPALPPAPPGESQQDSAQRVEEWNYQRQFALASLCLTSRRLHSVALPHLYHHPKPTAKWWLLVRTLVARPDLAAHARSLEFHVPERLSLKREVDQKQEQAARDPLLRAAFLKRRRAYLATLHRGPTVCRTDRRMRSLHHRDLESRRYESEVVNLETLFWPPMSFEYGYHHLPWDLLLSLLPNLEVLTASIGWAPAFRFCKPGSLPHLQHIDLSYRGECCWDSNAMRLDWAVRLFRAAGDRLESVDLRRFGKCGPLTRAPHPPQQQEEEEEEEEDDYKDEENDEEKADQGLLILPHVTRVTYRESCMFSEPLKNVISAFPNATHLELSYCRYRYEVEEHLELDHISSVLRDHAPRLQFFRFDARTYQNWEEGEEQVKSFLEDLKARGIKCEVLGQKVRHTPVYEVTEFTRTTEDM
ncbi:hypothetical protein VTJ49DRAFT_3288 [Mycothermus thermophilus]|uniref:F-box domain-containing protein n=1 Tax=Humicola insolens TaxID=85995 RepID=A0ABR3V7V0_HUMIN